jgi:hypothetical protein
VFNKIATMDFNHLHFENVRPAGVAGSSGESPGTVGAMAEHTAAFIAALGLSKARPRVGNGVFP